MIDEKTFLALRLHLLTKMCIRDRGIEERLLTRFKWGMVAELEKPTVELRKNILRNKIHRDGLQFPPEVIDYIAENVNESGRE